MITDNTVRYHPSTQGGTALFTGLGNLLGLSDQQNRLLLELRGSRAVFATELNETFANSHELFMRRLEQNETDRESLFNPLLFPSCLLTDFVPELVQLFLSFYSSLDETQRHGLGQYLSANGGIHALLGCLPLDFNDNYVRTPGRVAR